MASASDRPAGSGIVSGAMVGAMYVAAVAAAGTTLMILQFNEPFTDRTRLLILIVVCGAFSAAMPVLLMAGWIAAGWNRWLRATLGSLIIGIAFIPATMFCFAVENRIVEGRVEAESVADLQASDLFWSMFGAMGMFTPTGLRYLAPFPLIAMTAAAAILLFVWPRQTLSH